MYHKKVMVRRKILNFAEGMLILKSYLNNPNHTYEPELKTMTTETFKNLFTEERLNTLFPPGRADRFFDALFGDAAEGAYDIRLQFNDHLPEQKTLHFALELRERPGKCLACNLTYGLPEVFSRHPIINIRGLVQDIEKILDGRATCHNWRLGSTKTLSKSAHLIPLEITLG